MHSLALALLSALLCAAHGAIVDVRVPQVESLRGEPRDAAAPRRRIPAVVINLDRRTDRWASFLQAWSGIEEVELFRFPAIKHGEQLLYIDGEVKPLPNGVTASHLQVIEDAFKEAASPALDPAALAEFTTTYKVKPFAALRAGGAPPLEQVLVLEDDARPGLFWNTSFPRLVDYAAAHASKWEAINLAPSYAGTPPAYRIPTLYFHALPGTEDLLTTQSFVSSAAVLYNKAMAGAVSGLRRMAAGRTKDDDFAAIDVMYMEAGEAVRKWVSSPPLAYQAPQPYSDMSSTPTNFLTIFGVAGMDLGAIQQLLRYGAFEVSAEWEWRVAAVNDAYAALAAHVSTHAKPGHDGSDVEAYQASVAGLVPHLEALNRLKASLGAATSSDLRVRCDYAHPLDQTVWAVVSGTCGNEFRCGIERVLPNGTVQTPFFAGNPLLIPLDHSPQNATLRTAMPGLQACPPAPTPGPLPEGTVAYHPDSLFNRFVFINDDHSWHSMALSSIVDGRFAEVGCPGCHPASAHFTHMLAKELGWKGLLLAPRGMSSAVASYAASRPEFIGVLEAEIFDYVHPASNGLGTLIMATLEGEAGHSELQELLAAHGIKRFDFMVTITGDARRTPVALVPNNTILARGVAALHSKLGEEVLAATAAAAAGDSGGASHPTSVIHPTAQALAAALVHTVDSATICGDMALRAGSVTMDFIRHRIEAPYVQVVGGLTQCWPLVPADRPRTVRTLQAGELHKDTSTPEEVTLKHGSHTLKLLDILMQMNPRLLRMQEAAAFIGYEILRGTDAAYHLFRRDATLRETPFSTLVGITEDSSGPGGLDMIASLVDGIMDDRLDTDIFPTPGPSTRLGGLASAHHVMNTLIDRDVEAAQQEFAALQAAQAEAEAAAAAAAYDEWDDIAAHLGGGAA